MEIILIRHFYTRGNLEKRYIGTTDEPLLIDENSVRRARQLRMKYPAVDQVLVSPLKRCVETAGMIYPEWEPIPCSQFRECDFGLFEGKTYEELKSNPAYILWLESNGTVAFPGGEDHQAFKRRCIKGVEEMMTAAVRQKQKQTAVIVHGGTIMSILSRFDREQRGFYYWQLKNGEALSVIVDEDKWQQGDRYFREITKV